MRTSLISDKAPAAYQIGIKDQQVCRYMQTEVLAGEVEPLLFAAAVDGFRENFKSRARFAEPPFSANLVELNPVGSGLDPRLTDSVMKSLLTLGYDSKGAEAALGDLGWKISALPDNVSRIISVGCGGGAELVLLRARYPSAEIVAFDYLNYIRGGARTLEQLNVRFIEGELFENLARYQSGCDLLFSNHVIEHFYEPDEQIAALVRKIDRGGTFAAGLPLDAYVFADLLATLAQAPETVHPLDLNWLDLRHPWKTTETDVAATLVGAGLDGVTIFQRRRHVSRFLPITKEQYHEQEARRRRLYAMSMGPVLGCLKFLFGKAPPRRLCRLAYAVDRRFSFGRYRMKCDLAPEVFVTARKPA